MILAREDISKPNGGIKYRPGPTPDIILRVAATQQGAETAGNQEFRTRSARASSFSEHFLHRRGVFYTTEEKARVSAAAGAYL
jgi:hypothetical protein